MHQELDKHYEKRFLSNTLEYTFLKSYTEADYKPFAKIG